jgi:hypothetical protein
MAYKIKGLHIQILHIPNRLGAPIGWGASGAIVAGLLYWEQWGLIALNSP